MTPTTLATTVVLLLLFWASRGSASSSSSLKSHIMITHGFQTGEKLFVQCFSKKAILGIHHIDDGATYKFAFPVDESSNTDFVCDLAWEKGFLEFDGYNAPRDRKRCGNRCVWIAKKESVVGYTHQGNPDIVYHWRRPYPSHPAYPPSENSIP